jgi:dTDP-glucose pyrophosphorylase
MRCIMLCAGWSVLEDQIASQHNGHAVPKSLLKVGSKTLLDYWWDSITAQKVIEEVLIVTNSHKYKHFERWALEKGLPITHVINNGVTIPTASQGAAADLVLALKRSAKNRNRDLQTDWIDNEDVLVVAGDSLFYRDFDLGPVLAFHAQRGTNLQLCYELQAGEHTSQRGMSLLDDASKVISFYEKPAAGSPGAQFSLVSPLFYIFTPDTTKRLVSFVKQAQKNSTSSLGDFLAFAINSMPSIAHFHAMKLPSGFSLIGAKLELYEYNLLVLPYHVIKCNVHTYTSRNVETFKMCSFNPLSYLRLDILFPLICRATPCVYACNVLDVGGWVEYFSVKTCLVFTLRYQQLCADFEKQDAQAKDKVT